MILDSGLLFWATLYGYIYKENSCAWFKTMTICAHGSVEMQLHSTLLNYRSAGDIAWPLGILLTVLQRCDFCGSKDIQCSIPVGLLSNPCTTTTSMDTLFGANISHCQWYLQGRTGPPGCLTLDTRAGWSAGQVGRHVQCWRRDWNGGGGQGSLAREGGLSLDKLFPGAPSS